MSRVEQAAAGTPPQAPHRSSIGTSVRVVGLALLLLASSADCRKDQGSPPPEPLGRAPSGSYAGTYLLRPGSGAERLELRADGGALYHRGGDSFAGSYQVASHSLRVFVTPSKTGKVRVAPIGVFLLTDYDPSGWRGFWDDDVAFLIRRSGPGVPPPPADRTSGSGSESPGRQLP